MALFRLFLLVQLAAAIQVSTKNGKLKGEYIRNQLGNNYYAFRNITYTKPTIDKFRSKDPQTIGKLGGIRDTTSGWSGRGNTTNETQWSEDCSYLTVYTRKIRRWLPPTMVRTYQPSPVEVYFLGCSANTQENLTKSETDNILNRDVVKVLVHQRPSSPSGDIPDEGTKDQILALEWIKDNIISFGGDPHRVLVYQGRSSLADIDINRLSLGAQEGPRN